MVSALSFPVLSDSKVMKKEKILHTFHFVMYLIHTGVYKSRHYHVVILDLYIY